MKIVTLISFFLFASWSFSQPPQGYYDPAAGLYGPALQQALHDIIDDHTVLNYDFLYTAFESTDKKPNGKVWDMYSDIPGGIPPYEFTFGSDECGSYNSEGDCYNREHSWPRSWFNDMAPMDSDLFHLYPTDGYVNNKRSNHPYGKVGSASWTSDNGCKLGDCITAGYSGTVFEPIDTYKGDLARTYFYMATRYYKEDQSWPGSPMTNGSQLKSWAITMLLQWHQDDPVSQKEIDRNNAAYGFQNNRNPFIDHPEYAPDIWGPNAGYQLSQNVPILEAYPNPCAHYCCINTPGTSTEQIQELLVYSFDGMEYDVKFDVEADKATIFTSTLPQGIYFVRIKMKGSSSSYFSKIIRH